MCMPLENIQSEGAQVRIRESFTMTLGRRRPGHCMYNTINYIQKKEEGGKSSNFFLAVYCTLCTVYSWSSLIGSLLSEPSERGERGRLRKEEDVKSANLCSSVQKGVGEGQLELADWSPIVQAQYRREVVSNPKGSKIRQFFLAVYSRGVGGRSAGACWCWLVPHGPRSYIEGEGEVVSKGERE